MRNIFPGLMLGLVLLFSSCGRDEKNDVDIAGKGGNATMRISPVHGASEVIEGCILYLKYNSQDKPSDDRYDETVACTMVDGHPQGSFTGLKKGDYYIFGKGYNPDHGDTVKGGYPYHIDDDQKTYDITLNLGH